AITKIPVIYPPELSFLGKIPVLETFIVRSMLSGPVYASPRVSFLAFFSYQGDFNILTLLVTSKSLMHGLDDVDLELLSILYKPMRRVGWLERLQSQLRENNKWKEQLRQWHENGMLDARSVQGMSKLYVPVIHPDNILITFPEDDFTEERDRSFDQALKLSRIMKVCKNIQPLRCGLPKLFCDKLLEEFRI
ncbi:MAG TPA: hypothetical protein VMW63_04875, partial [Methanoregulaceae archaeon]|nr:hypothetical protein [Methanoregulaceae archaeon]